MKGDSHRSIICGIRVLSFASRSLLPSVPIAIRIITSNEMASISPSSRISEPSSQVADSVACDSRDQLAIALGVPADHRKQDPSMMQVLGTVHDQDRVVADDVPEDPVGVAGAEVLGIGREHLLGRERVGNHEDIGGRAEA